MLETTDARLTKEEAQRRVDGIRRFREELARLEADGVLALSETQRASVARHHDGLLETLASRFDIDRSDAERQMSLGMRVASLVGAIAFSAAVFLFFLRYWGAMGTTLQVSVLVGAPLLALAGVDVAARRDKTLYFASILALLAFATFIMDISVLAGIFNVKDSPAGMAIWAIFALALAYAYGLTWLLAVGVATGAAYVAALLAQWSGIGFGFFMMRPEGLILPGAAALAMAAFEFRRGRPAFGATYRYLGWVGVLFPMLFMAADGHFSYVRAWREAVSWTYVVAGFALGGAAVWSGIRRQATALVNTATLFLSLLLFIKLFDWWWDWMPRYLFFFLLGVIAIGILVSLRRLRTRAWKV